MESLVLRPRKATEIVDAAIEVYRRNPVHFMLLAAIVQVPWTLLQIVFVAGQEMASMEMMVRSMLIAFGGWISYLLVGGLVVDMASELYLGREADAFSTLRRVGLRIIPVFFASLFQALGIAVGILLLLFPAVLVTAVTFAVVPVVVIEKLGVFSAFRRSYRLSLNSWNHILSSIALIIIITVVIQIGFTFLLVFLQTMQMPRLQYAIAGLLGILLKPAGGIAWTLIYYDIRIRKEGFDIEMMAGKSGEPAPVTV